MSGLRCALLAAAGGWAKLGPPAVGSKSVGLEQSAKEPSPPPQPSPAAAASQVRSGSMLDPPQPCPPAWPLQARKSESPPPQPALPPRSLPPTRFRAFPTAVTRLPPTAHPSLPWPLPQPPPPSPPAQLPGHPSSEAAVHWQRVGPCHTAADSSTSAAAAMRDRSAGHGRRSCSFRAPGGPWAAEGAPGAQAGLPTARRASGFQPVGTRGPQSGPLPSLTRI